MQKRKEDETKRKRDQEQKKGVVEERGRNRTQLLQQSKSGRDTEQLHWMPDLSVSHLTEPSV
jgi:hypothetical protein